MDSGRKKQNVKEVPWKEHAPYVMEMQYYYACGRLWFMMSRRALSQVRLINLAILCRSWAVEFYANVVVFTILQWYIFRGKGSALKIPSVY